MGSSFVVVYAVHLLDYPRVYDVHLSSRTRKVPLAGPAPGGAWMATKIDQTERPRSPLSRERIVGAAVALADREGVESLSMRRLAQELGVVPMALYKHVASKDEMLDGMVDAGGGEIDRGLAD